MDTKTDTKRAWESGPVDASFFGVHIFAGTGNQPHYTTGHGEVLRAVERQFCARTSREPRAFIAHPGASAAAGEIPGAAMLP